MAEIQKSSGFLQAVGRVVALAVPVLCAFGIFGTARQIYHSAEAINDLVIAVVVQTAFLLVTGFLAICVCMTMKSALLRFAKILALTCSVGIIAFGIACLLTETFLGVCVRNWVNDTVFLVPIFAFYWWLLARKLKSVNQAEETMAIRGKSDEGSNNYYVRMSDILDHSKEREDGTRDVSP